MRKTRILGISCYYHDSAAAIVEDGTIIAAAQEERFTRVKGDSSFPHNAISFCLDTCGIRENELDHVVFYENPIIKFDRLLTTYHVTAPNSLVSFLKSFPSWLSKKLWLEKEIRSELGNSAPIHFCDHHLSHAASAYYPSPYEKAAILTIDGVGEWSTASYGIGSGNKIELLEQIRFPNSLGLLYSAFTYYTGFKINSGEYKLMGLAPYGQPKYVDIIKQKIIQLRDDGSIILNQKYFNYTSGLTMTNSKFNELFGGPPRQQESQITQKEMDIASSIQTIVNEALLLMSKHVYAKTKMDNLCLAGGVALNVVAVGGLSMNGPFKNIWTQPAAGDAGGALGAALWFWHQVKGGLRTANPSDDMRGGFLGLDILPKSEEDDEILTRLGAVWDPLSESDIQEAIAQKISDGKIVGVARGRAEFGPRALGARSILGDARLVSTQSHMNLKIKFRESFRPFAPMVLVEDAGKYFDIEQESPYMLLVYPISKERRIAQPKNKELFGIDLLKLPRSDIPAVTHVDYSARVQTVDKLRNPFMYGVIDKFKSKTGCSVIVNTSFNVRSEPIVNSVEDAYRCFMATEIDYLVIGNRLFSRESQNNNPMTSQEREKWLKRFELD